MAERIYMPLYHTYLDSMADLSDEEFGKLVRASLRYSISGEKAELTGMSQMAFKFIQADIDRAKKEYEKRSNTNKQNINKRWEKQENTTVYDMDTTVYDRDTTQYDRIRSNTNVSSGIQSYEYKVKESKVKESKGNESKVNEKERESSPPDGGTHTEQDQKHKYGQYGRVRLTDVEYRKLSYDLGETELKRCIDYVDESAQMTDNKNKWKDWNLVLRKCHKEGWGLKQDQTDSNKNDKVVTDDDIFPEVAYYHDRDGVQHCIRRKKP